jgi:hypothetical protein
MNHCISYIYNANLLHYNVIYSRNIIDAFQLEARYRSKYNYSLAITTKKTTSICWSNIRLLGTFYMKTFFGEILAQRPP